MRRLLSSLLALLTLVLSCIPCSDVAAAPRATEQVSATRLDAGTGGCGHHDADLCSPFCTCACCAGVALPVHPAATAPAAPAHSVVRAFRAAGAGALLDGHRLIWQPPQLG